MAKDKERSVNPAQAQRKAEKAKALKKARNEQQVKRNEKLARRNPDRIQKQIDELKALEAAGEIKPREQAILADLERDLKAIRKARETVGPKPSSTTDNKSRPLQNTTRDNERGERGNSVLGKRRYDGRPKFQNDELPSGSETDESVRNIPMPRDTPPPMPRHHRGHPRSNEQHQADRHSHAAQSSTTAAPPAYESKTTYTSAPQLRDLKKEATARFVPDIVRRKQDAVRGHGGLLEPEELDSLEKEGYTAGQPAISSTPAPSPHLDNKGHTEEAARKLREEEERFQRELEGTMDVDTVMHNSDAGSSTAKNSIHESRDNVVADEEEEEEDESYLPPLLSGNGMFNGLPPPQSGDAQQSTASANNGASIAAGLFGSLPKPKHESVKGPTTVHMEEVEDEDL